MMSDLLIAFGAAFVLILGTFVFATHMTLYQDYKYYKPTYKLLNQLNDGTKISMLGNGYVQIKIEGHDEIIFFEDGAIKLAYDAYLHNSFFKYFSPYVWYYHYKFNKLKSSLINIYNRDHIDFLDVSSYERHFTQSQLSKSKELSFKFFRG